MQTRKKTMRIGHFSLIALFFLINSLQSCTLINQKTIVGSPKISTVRHETYKRITGIEVGSIIAVNVIQSEEEFVEISANENILPFVEIKQKGSELFLDMDENYQYKRADILVTIATSKIQMIGLSGASKASFTGDWECENLSIRMSGASELEKLNAKSNQTSVHLSGATELSALLKSEEMYFNSSGAADAHLQLYNNLNCSLHLSGSSDLSIRGDCRTLSVNGSGSSDIDAEKFHAESVDIKLSGSSSIEAYAQKHLSYSLSGSSSANIYGQAEETRHKLSGSATITRHN